MEAALEGRRWTSETAACIERRGDHVHSPPSPTPLAVAAPLPLALTVAAPLAACHLLELLLLSMLVTLVVCTARRPVAASVTRQGTVKMSATNEHAKETGV